jgi:hypothetical protein
MPASLSSGRILVTWASTNFFARVFVASSPKAKLPVIETTSETPANIDHEYESMCHHRFQKMEDAPASK